MANSEFIIGQTYSREEIHKAIGGDKQGMFPMAGGRVVCCCIKPDVNPQAPSSLFVGDHPKKYRAARQWADEGHDIPILVKRAVNHWEYIGQYHVVRASEDVKDRQSEEEKIGYLPRIILQLEPRR